MLRRACACIVVAHRRSCESRARVVCSKRSLLLGQSVGSAAAAADAAGFGLPRWHIGACSENTAPNYAEGSAVSKTSSETMASARMRSLRESFTCAEIHP